MYLRPTRSLSFAWRRSCLAKPQNFFSWIMKVFTSFSSHGFAAASFFWSSIQAHWVQAPIWSSILIFVHSTIWRDFSKRLRSHCISSRLSRLQWIEKSPPNQIHDIHFLPFAAFSGQRPAHLKTTKRRRRRYLAPMMMSKRIPKIM